MLRAGTGCSTAAPRQEQLLRQREGRKRVSHISNNSMPSGSVADRNNLHWSVNSATQVVCLKASDENTRFLEVASHKYFLFNVTNTKKVKAVVSKQARVRGGKSDRPSISILNKSRSKVGQ